MLGYVAAKETYLFLPLFEYENRIFIKGVIYPKKNIVLYKVCPDIDINDKIEEDSLPVNNSDGLLRGEIVNISRDITSKTIPNEAFLGKLSKNKDIIEAYFKNKYLGTVRKNKIKFIQKEALKIRTSLFLNEIANAHTGCIPWIGRTVITVGAACCLWILIGSAVIKIVIFFSNINI